MSKKNNYVVASLNGKTFMCEEDDPRLENGNYTIQTGRFLKDKNTVGGVKVLGVFKASNNTDYIIYTNKNAVKLELSDI